MMKKLMRGDEEIRNKMKEEFFCEEKNIKVCDWSREGLE